MDPFLQELDLHLFNAGRHYRIYEKLGAHPTVWDGRPGTHFAVWAPTASAVSVMGEWNDWDDRRDRMIPVQRSGIWECFVPYVGPGTLYKYVVWGPGGKYRAEKADPFGFAAELRPRNASKVWDLGRYRFADDDWMARRKERHEPGAPISIYEVHLGSWRRVPEEGDRWATYRELAHMLKDYVLELGFTHVELLPITEHPYDGSWGYQTIGYYAPTSRFGTPDDFRYFVDVMHQAGIGVILDWVPAHFPRDGHGLGYFDGTHLYEHAHPFQGEHRDWGTLIYNYGRPEVANYLITNALFWFREYHIDGLRVDAVASMLYLDYSRQAGEWIPNQYGGRENLEALEFLRHMNSIIGTEQPDVLMFAEESTAWPMVSRPSHLGGLGFNYKWDMGWMHDSLRYFAKDPIHRRFHHNDLTFRMLYAWQERYVLPLSHDEVVHGKRSLIGKMPGDTWQQFASLRLLFGHMFAQPAKKLLFMGGEFGQWNEWYHEVSLDWHLVERPLHAGLKRWVRDCNRLYRDEPAMHELELRPDGFSWIDCNDSDQSIVSLLRWAENGDCVMLALNFTPVPRHGYRIGVPYAGFWPEVLNSDAREYGGSGLGNLGGQTAEAVPWHGHPASLLVTLPPLAVVAFKGTRPPEPPPEEEPGGPRSEAAPAGDAAVAAAPAGRGAPTDPPPPGGGA